MIYCIFGKKQIDIFVKWSFFKEFYVIAPSKHLEKLTELDVFPLFLHKKEKIRLK